MEVVVPGIGPRRVLSLPDQLRTILVPLGATVTSLALADIAFWGLGQAAVEGRASFWFVQAPLPSESYSVAMVAFITGAVAVHTKRWALPLTVGVIAYLMVEFLLLNIRLEPGWVAFSSPAGGVVSARIITIHAAMILNAVLIIISVHRQRKA